MTVHVTFDARRIIATTFLVVGITCLGVYAASLLYSNAYQLYEGWRFDKATVADRPGVETARPRIVTGKPAQPSLFAKPAERKATLSADPSVIGRVTVPRLSLSAMVDEGTDDDTLERAVGHVPGTALPGARGNVAIAGHRDSFFRALKDLRRNDEIDFQTLDGSYRYTVDQLSVVDPADTSVLAATNEKTLTIVTCFPFHYIGPAPRRFIVRARQVSELSRRSQ